MLSLRWFGALLLGAFALFATTLSANANPVDEECKAPIKPAIVFDGAAATQDEVQATFDSIKRYQTQLVEYRSCLDDKIAAAKAAEDKDAVTALTDAYNASVDEETAVVEAFNVEYQKFKAKKP